MRSKATPRCPNCRRLQAQLDALQTQREALRATVAQLEEQLARARKNSSTSSKPPSSDLVKPPKPLPADGSAKRSRGAQRGHPLHTRPAFPPEAVEVHPHRLEHCPDCGHHLEDALT